MPYLVASGQYINAVDINQVVQILYRQTGQQETGRYYLVGNASASSQSVGDYVGSLSRGSTPTGSVSIDTSVQSPTNCASPTADTLDANGFRVITTSTSAANNIVVSGGYTINY